VQPIGRDQITSPQDIAALLMVEMSHLEQEQLRVVCLNTKNYVQKIHLVYQGSVNSPPVRVAEVFREPIHLNSEDRICTHKHDILSLCLRNEQPIKGIFMVGWQTLQGQHVGKLHRHYFNSVDALLALDNIR
jgi:hypothetical protein